MLETLLKSPISDILDGIHSKKSTPFTIDQLLPVGSGRVAAIYTDPARPSYDEVIEQNRKALGPERVVNGNFSDGLNGWYAPSGAWTEYQGAARLLGDGSVQTLRQNNVFVVGRSYLIEFTVRIVAGAQLVAENAAGSTVVGGASGKYVTVWVADRAELSFKRSGTVTEGYIDDVSVREIVDWSQIVLTDDLNATVPIFSVLQPQRGRGWLMDRSFGMVRGPELFDGNHSTGWGFGAGISGAADKITFTAAATTQSCTRPILAISKTYEVRFRVQAYVSGQVRLIASSGQSGPAVAANGTHVQKISTTGAAGNIGFQPITSNFTGEVVLESVKELPGNHLSQPTAAARGEFSARYNMLTATDTLGSPNTANSVTLTTGQAAPDGSLTAIKVTETTASGQHFVAANLVAVASGIAHKICLYQKAAGRTLCAVETVLNSGGGVDVLFNLSTGVATATPYGGAPAATASMTDVGDGWWKCEAVITTNGTTLTVRMGKLYQAPGAQSYTGDGTSGVFVWAPDVRLAADAIPSIPEYQRVTSATDYETVGFPAYHRVVTYDWAFADINPLGATSLTVIAAVQNFNTGGFKPIVEMAPITDTTQGTFNLGTPGGPTRFSFQSFGSTRVQAVSNEYPLAIRAVLVGQGDILNDVSRLSVNGSVAANNTSDQGTGTYTPQRFYFDARGGTSLFADSRKVAPETIIFCQPGDTLSPAHLTRLQRAYAKAAGVAP